MPDEEWWEIRTERPAWLDNKEPVCRLKSLDFTLQTTGSHEKLEELSRKCVPQLALPQEIDFSGMEDRF